jgi:hypothetical protein
MLSRFLSRFQQNPINSVIRQQHLKQESETRPQPKKGNDPQPSFRGSNAAWLDVVNTTAAYRAESYYQTSNNWSPFELSSWDFSQSNVVNVGGDPIEMKNIVTMSGNGLPSQVFNANLPNQKSKNVFWFGVNANQTANYNLITQYDGVDLYGKSFEGNTIEANSGQNEDNFILESRRRSWGVGNGGGYYNNHFSNNTLWLDGGTNTSPLLGAENDTLTYKLYLYHDETLADANLADVFSHEGIVSQNGNSYTQITDKWNNEINVRNIENINIEVLQYNPDAEGYDVLATNQYTFNEFEGELGFTGGNPPEEEAEENADFEVI